MRGVGNASSSNEVVTLPGQVRGGEALHWHLCPDIFCSIARQRTRLSRVRPGTISFTSYLLLWPQLPTVEGLGLGESLDGEAAMLVHSAAQCCVDSCVRNQVSLKLTSNFKVISWSNVSFELG